MDLYLSYKQIPEFKNLPDDVAYRRFRICQLKSFLHWKQWLGMGFLISSIAIWGVIVKKGLPFSLGIPMTHLLEVILLLVFSEVGALVYLLFLNQAIRSIYQRNYPEE